MKTYVNLSGHSGPKRAVLSRPKCAALMGAIAAEWAYVEDNQALLFSSAVGKHERRPDGGFDLSRNWPALVTMRETNSNHMRLQIIERALIALLPDDFRTEWKELKKTMLAVAIDRNTVVHATWNVADDYPDDLIELADDGKTFRWTVSDFEEILRSVETLRASTWEFLNRILIAQHEGRAKSF